ncbi:MAG: AraC family transcriptional regulator [Bacteroidales bacterium]|nr:AraC family transcriptional regulator [Bacteroidales bacterium]
MDIRLTERHQPLGHPCRFDGFLLLYCVTGRIRLNVNLAEYEIGEGMMYMHVPGNIVRVNDLVDTAKEDVRYICMAMSNEFVKGLSFDANKIFNEGMAMLDNPSARLNEAEMDIMNHGIGLIGKIVGAELPYKKEVLNSVVSSMFYMIMGVWNDRAEDNRLSNSTRSRMIFDQFIKLVSEYHTQYRNVGFYADKLCLTPKYLSKLIKNATGRSAPDWIDSYVILEAKNLLKYSSVTVKEIVYKLNFPNQSVFYKFFKARTGMTPTEYRNS